MNSFDIIKQNKNILSTDFEINSDESFIKIGEVTYSIGPHTVELIATSLVQAKDDPAILRRLNNLFESKQIQLSECLHNARYLCTANDYFHNWLETSDFHDFDTAAHFCLMDYKPLDGRDYYNVLLSPQRPDMFLKCVIDKGKEQYEIHYIKSENTQGLICSGQSLVDVMAKYDSIKENPPTPISFLSDRARAYVKLKDGVVVEVQQSREIGSVANPTNYIVRLIDGNMVSGYREISNDPLSILNLRDGKIDYNEFVLSRDDITDTVLNSNPDVKIKLKENITWEQIQDIIAKSAVFSNDKEHSTFVCLESESCPYQISFRHKNPQNCNDIDEPNFELQVKNKLGIETHEYATRNICPSSIAAVLNFDPRLNRRIHDEDIVDEMFADSPLRTSTSDLKTEDVILKYISFNGESLEHHLTEHKERMKLKNNGLSPSI